MDARTRSTAALLVPALALAASGCGRTDGSPSGGRGSCADVLVLDGRRYVGTAPQRDVKPAARLDATASYRGCDDGGGPAVDDGPNGFPARALPGVPPALAFVVRRGGGLRVYVERDTDPCALAYTRC